MRKRRSKKKQQDHSISRLFPNFVTLLGLCAGLFALKFALASKWEMAVGAVAIAAFIDGMDGRLARLLNASSRFGAELDSLSDFVNFGVVPALITYMWSTHEVRGIGWAVTLFFIICMALRLARFNSAIEEEPSDKALRDNFFFGVPAPAGALFALLPLMLTFLKTEHPWLNVSFINPESMTGYIAIMALLLVSRLPTFSFKKVRIRKEFGSLVLAFAALVTIALILEPWTTLPIIGAGYIILLPFSLASYYRTKRRNKIAAELQ